MILRFDMEEVHKQEDVWLKQNIHYSTIKRYGLDCVLFYLLAHNPKSYLFSINPLAWKETHWLNMVSLREASLLLGSRVIEDAEAERYAVGYQFEDYAPMFMFGWVKDKVKRVYMPRDRKNRRKAFTEFTRPYSEQRKAIATITA